MKTLLRKLVGMYVSKYGEQMPGFSMRTVEYKDTYFAHFICWVNDKPPAPVTITWFRKGKWTSS